jgi:outer membrane biogenesis lipoprotein LolB
MSSRSFRSVFMVASCATAALGCYLVSLRVASERAQLEDVESRIVVAQRDMRVLQTEIGTRGRLSQLERWNAGAFALSAPNADQFLKGSFELAQLVRPDHKVQFQAPVVLATAPAPAPQTPLGKP